QLISNENVDRAAIYQLLNMPETTLTFESFGTIFINDSLFPITVEFTDSIQTIRYKPRKGYFSIFQPKGVKALAIASEGDWYKLQLAPNQYAWANKNSVRLLPKGILPPKSYLSVIRTFNSQNNLKIQFPLSGKHPFKIIEMNKKEIKIQLYGVISDTDWIRYDSDDEFLDYAVWNQPEPEVYELTLYLKDNIWGYDSYYEGNNFILQLNKAPEDIDDLDGKIIVVDPGHSSDKGAIGPTGLTEADANLAISLKVREELTKKGAIVIMTRDDKRNVNLYDRPSIAKANDADMFISIHNNALPDGVNPFVNNGTSVYYYHLHSIELGRNVHAELMKELKLNNYGFYHGNLAVNRPTQYPAILVECAFMILPEQEALLKTEKFQKKIAKGIRKGIEEFLEDFKDD
ncbi:MAG: N-acetylmuramoyl-L-alanine amidase, partial [candidate division Zixibacteria bacterium]|nr:N-acetylmuramoyl-L-alanine amidase [candidate division Zixibacteria bacterium]